MTEIDDGREVGYDEAVNENAESWINLGIAEERSRIYCELSKLARRLGE